MIKGKKYGSEWCEQVDRRLYYAAIILMASMPYPLRRLFRMIRTQSRRFAPPGSDATLVTDNLQPRSFSRIVLGAQTILGELGARRDYFFWRGRALGLDFMLNRRSVRQSGLPSDVIPCIRSRY
jgi:hypothetical protein